MDQTKGSVKGAASIKTASILLVAIVSIFIFYANTIFIKRRSKEIWAIPINRDALGLFICTNEDGRSHLFGVTAAFVIFINQRRGAGYTSSSTSTFTAPLF